MTARANIVKIEQLADFPKSTGRNGEELMNDAVRDRSEVERDNVRRFAIARDRNDNYDNARRECEEVVKRETPIRERPSARSMSR